MKNYLLIIIALTFSGLVLAQEQTSTNAMDELDAVIKTMETKGFKEVKDKKFDLRSIQFITGTSKLTPPDEVYLDSLANYLKRIPSVKMEIGGHTDNSGSYKLNKRLSEDRANAVVTYLKGKGVVTTDMEVRGYSSDVPIASNKTPEGKAMNRRVEIKFLGLTGSTLSIMTKDGKTIAAGEVIFGNDGSLSYRVNENSPLMKIPFGDVEYVEYPDGSRRTPGMNGAVNPYTGADYTPPAPIYESTETASPTSAPGSSRWNGLGDLGNWLSTKFPKIYRWSAIGNLGVSPLSVKAANINFAYVDESPSRDNLQRLIELKDGSLAGVGQFGFEWETDGHFVGRIQYQFGRGRQAGMSGLVFGIGKAMGKRQSFIPSIDLTFGSAYLKLGDLYQNDVFIQVNNSKFYSDYVRIQFRNYFAALTPQIAYSFDYKDNISFRITGGYSYSFNTKSALQFTGSDNNNKSVKAKEKLTVPNVSLAINDVKSTNPKLFGLQGPYVTFGVLYHLYQRSGER